MGIFSFLKRKTKNKVIICGLDSAGKSTIVSFLQTGRFIPHAPTMGKAKAELEIEGTLMTLMDMGGQVDFRALWMGELQTAEIIIFVIDKNNTARFEEARKEIANLSPLIKKRNVPLVVLANKSDIMSDVNVAQIIKALNLSDIENFQIFQTSARTGLGLADAFASIYSILSGQPIKKRVMAHAISVFNFAGNPVYSCARTEAENNLEALRGCLFASITDFCKNVEGECPDQISIKSKTILIEKSKNYIGTLVWSPELGVDITDAKESLKQLIDQMEILCPVNSDSNQIKYYVDQFITNIM